MNKHTGETISCPCDRCKKTRRDATRVVMIAELMRDGKTVEEAIEIFNEGELAEWQGDVEPVIVEVIIERRVYT